MLKQQFMSFMCPLLQLREVLQKCCKLQSGEPAALETWCRCSDCSPALMLNLGAENPHVASAYVPGDPQIGGIEHKAPG